MKDIATGAKATGSIIKTKQMLNITKGVICTTNSNWLKKIGGPLNLVIWMVKSFLRNLDWRKLKKTTGKIDLWP